MNPFPFKRKILTVPGCDSFRIVLEQDIDGDVEIHPQVKDEDEYKGNEWREPGFIWMSRQAHILAQLGFPTEPPASEETVEGLVSDERPLVDFVRKLANEDYRGHSAPHRTEARRLLASIGEAVEEER